MQLRNPLPLVSPEHKLLFLTNGKCAGTSVKAWFIMIMDLEPDTSRISRLEAQTSPDFAAWFHENDGPEMLKHLDDHKSVQRLTSELRRKVSAAVLKGRNVGGYQKLWFVRDPVTRCASGYYNKFCGADISKPWAQGVVAEAGTDGGMSFDQFVGYLETSDPDTVNEHWRRQTYNAEMFGDDLKPVRQEEMHADLAALNMPVLTNNLPNFPRMNVQARDKTRPPVALPAEASMLSNLDIVALEQRHESTINPQSLLSPTLVRRIVRIYARDYEKLPYDRGTDRPNGKPSFLRSLFGRS